MLIGGDEGFKKRRLRSSKQTQKGNTDRNTTRQTKRKLHRQRWIRSQTGRDRDRDMTETGDADAETDKR